MHLDSHWLLTTLKFELVEKWLHWRIFFWYLRSKEFIGKGTFSSFWRIIHCRSKFCSTRKFLNIFTAIFSSKISMKSLSIQNISKNHLINQNVFYRWEEKLDKRYVPNMKVFKWCYAGFLNLVGPSTDQLETHLESHF